MIPNIDSKPTMKPFKDVSGIFVTVNFDGNYLTWVKIPEVFDSNAAKGWNAYCFDNNSLSYFKYDTLVTDPTSVNMKKVYLVFAESPSDATQHIYHITDCFLPCSVEALNEDKIYPIKTI